jgi:large subunit ribosomal protein L9
MQIVLLEKIPNLGALGDVVRVKDGFARNFLIPQKKAKRATSEAIAEIEARRAELEAIALQKLGQAQQLAEKMGSFQLKMSQKAGIDGRLFGAVTNASISELLSLAGFSVHKSQVRMADGHLKTVGEFSVDVVLHPEVVVALSVRIEAEVQ